jgi:hypothetical protein
VPRTNASAKQAGSRFERTTADYLKDHLSEFIDRKVRTGAKDTGDIANVRTASGRRVAVECKDYGGRLNLAEWVREAEAERVNDGADVGLVVAKRRGTAKPGEQWVILTVDGLIELLRG